MTFPSTLHLFCRVVDNYGDIGVCWRLARQLQGEHGIAVTLWVDDLRSFQRICSTLDARLPMQHAEAVVVRQWEQHFGPVVPADVADVVVEAFACELPSAYVTAMAARQRAPVWINLEYLSAESWIEGCHRMPSRHPVLPLTKHFFFPGFTAKTGGLAAERSLSTRRRQFQEAPLERAAFLAALNIALPENTRLLSLFCYPSAPVSSLFDALQADARNSICVVPHGVATDALAEFLGSTPEAGAMATRGALTVQVLPFVDQPDYDRLLWSCDLNFVRGEDSFVRAQWAARPFVWHIYPQQDATHMVKLDAFLQRYENDMPAGEAAAVDAISKAWNQGQALGSHWPPFERALPGLCAHAMDWELELVANGDLASNLVQFVREIS